jgi:hypothetical protein
MTEKYYYDIFLICPVRNATPDQKVEMQNYINVLESQGISVYYPARDTDQTDTIGWAICTKNLWAMEHSKKVHIFYDPTSTGSLFDLGMAFALDKELTVVNINQVEATDGKKSFNNLIRYWHDPEL